MIFFSISLACHACLSSSQGQLVEERGCKDAFCSLAVNSASDNLPQCVCTKPSSINDPEQALILLFLPMCVEHKEDNGTSACRLGKVAQVHERRLREEGQVCVAEPDKETGAVRLINAGVLVECLRATQTCTGIKDELAASVGEVGQE